MRACEFATGEKKKSRLQGDVINVGITEDAQKKPEAKHSVKIIIIIISFYNLLYLKSEALFAKRVRQHHLLEKPRTHQSDLYW